MFLYKHAQFSKMLWNCISAKKKDIFHIQTNNSQLLQLVWKTRCVLSTHLCVHARADIHTHAFVHAWRSEVNFRCRPSWFLRQGPKISHGLGAHPLGQAVWPGSQGSCCLCLLSPGMTSVWPMPSLCAVCFVWTLRAGRTSSHLPGGTSWLRRLSSHSMTFSK